ncbi:hypothetical protein, partial [Nonomuraea sp. NPDC005650]|uniref:hypothetical protein n=1 Tax=Nonomuraea sp. NPDC005650 TaxID=3157045 RepID=UPI0033A8A048
MLTTSPPQALYRRRTGTERCNTNTAPARHLMPRRAPYPVPPRRAPYPVPPRRAPYPVPPRRAPYPVPPRAA